MKALIFISLMVVVFSCKTTRPDSSGIKLIGGAEISEDQWPSIRRLAILKRETTGAYITHSHCTMTFIKPDLALTAAHCLCSGHRFVYADAERWEEFTAIRTEKHPRYDCGERIPNSYDVGLVWFNKAADMKTSRIVEHDTTEVPERVYLVGYGDNILKITGHFWTGTRRPVTDRAEPSKRSGDREFKGKRFGEVSWGDQQAGDPGFIRLSARFSAQTPVEEPMDQVASAQGDSGGPAITDSNTVLAVISRGSHKLVSRGSDLVDVATDLVDLRRPEIRSFLRNFKAID